MFIFIYVYNEHQSIRIYEHALQLINIQNFANRGLHHGSYTPPRPPPLLAYMLSGYYLLSKP